VDYWSDQGLISFQETGTAYYYIWHIYTVTQRRNYYIGVHALVIKADSICVGVTEDINLDGQMF